MLKNQNKNTATATNIIKVCYSDAKYFAVYAITVSGLSLDNTYVGWGVNQLTSLSLIAHASCLLSKKWVIPIGI